LVLPKGGSRQDLVGTDALYDYVASQALEWFQSSDGYSKFGISISVHNGHLYLVTGVDQVPEWSVLSFWRHKKSTNAKSNEANSGRSTVPQPSDRPVSDDNSIAIDYRYGDSEPWTTPESDVYRIWDNHLAERWHEGRHSNPFIRGLRIALSPPTWKEYLPTNTPDARYCLPTTTLAYPWSNVIPPSLVQALPITELKLEISQVSIMMLHLRFHFTEKHSSSNSIPPTLSFR